MIRAAALALALACAGPALAQSNGSTGGSNASADAPCPELGPMIRFCGTAPHFVLMPQSVNSVVTFYYQTDVRVEVAAVIDPIGIADGVTIDSMQEIILENLSLATGTPIDQLPEWSRGAVRIDGELHPNFIYRGTVDGVMYVYSNSVLLLENTVAQFVTIEAGGTIYTPRHSAVHTQFLENLQVGQ